MPTGRLRSFSHLRARQTDACMEGGGCVMPPLLTPLRSRHLSLCCAIYHASPLDEHQRCNKVRRQAIDPAPTPTIKERSVARRESMRVLLTPVLGVYSEATRTTANDVTRVDSSCPRPPAASALGAASSRSSRSDTPSRCARCCCCGRRRKWGGGRRAHRRAPCYYAAEPRKSRAPPYPRR